MKCLVGLRDGGILLAIVNFPLQGALCHSLAQAVCVVALAQSRAKALEVPIGAFHASWVASLASSSALSFPFMLQWLRHHATLIAWVLLASRNFVILWWNLAA